MNQEGFCFDEDLEVGILSISLNVIFRGQMDVLLFVYNIFEFMKCDKNNVIIIFLKREFECVMESLKEV